MYKFTYIDEKSDDNYTVEISSRDNDMDIYELNTLFNIFLIACTFSEESLLKITKSEE